MTSFCSAFAAAAVLCFALATGAMAADRPEKPPSDQLSPSCRVCPMIDGKPVKMPVDKTRCVACDEKFKASLKDKKQSLLIDYCPDDWCYSGTTTGENPKPSDYCWVQTCCLFAAGDGCIQCPPC